MRMMMSYRRLHLQDTQADRTRNGSVLFLPVLSERQRMRQKICEKIKQSSQEAFIEIIVSAV